MSTEEEYKELSAKLRYGLELAESGGNNAASVAVCTCSEMESGWNR